MRVSLTRQEGRAGCAWTALCAALVISLAGAVSATAAPPARVPVERAYAIGHPKLRTIWVDPRAGRDARGGATRRRALKTLDAAWRRIPQGRTLVRTGFRIRIARGRLPVSAVPNYFESRHGTKRFPIIIEAADGPGTVTLPGLNIFDTRYLYLIDLRVASTLGDVVHCEACDHFLLRRTVVRGAPAASGKVGEGVKVNQSRYVFLESNDISGASDNPLDMVAVQHAAVLSNRIHDGGDWCAYAKGGSAYVRVAGNEFFNCGTGGFTAGQGTGFQFMRAPWLQYEAYDVKVYDNVVHDVDGAGLGVNGGYDVLLAHNTLYHVGARDHLLEFVAGHRSCDGQPGDEGRKRCNENLARGGWGTTRVDDGENYVRIPNRHVYVYDNLLYNPPGVQSLYTHFTVAAPYSSEWQAGSNAPSLALFDDDLQIRGNVVWNGPADHPSGLGAEGTGCTDGHPTCSDAQLRADNAINVDRPALADPARGRYAPAAGDGVLAARTFAIPAFTWDDAPAGVPAGTLSNTVARDRAGAARGTTSPPGAYVR
jgi:Right handed beta helix region